MKTLILIILASSLIGCGSQDKSTSGTFSEDNEDSINLLLDKWHTAAAEAKFKDYFDQMAKDGVFLGTDATENWQNEDFRSFAKPYFDKGKAWSFTTLDRNIYFSSEGNIAWFDELLDTQMGICRGSGVLEHTAEGWKIKHYVLSIAIPNENVSEVTQLKKEFDEGLIEKLTQ